MTIKKGISQMSVFVFSFEVALILLLHDIRWACGVIIANTNAFTFLEHIVLIQVSYKYTLPFKFRWSRIQSKALVSVQVGAAALPGSSGALGGASWSLIPAYMQII